ncbi:MAG: DUF3108 domain-containing protein [Gammaproteobacteria bacterium]|tara:strand:+ start:2930 stop:3625 length:696 start_codon:yes stop_codon:yes gene_type:complete
MKINNLLLSFILLTGFLNAADAIKPSKATLELDMGAKMEVQMSQLPNGTWKLTSSVDYGSIFKRMESEVFELKDNQIKPISYEFNQRQFFRKEKNYANFNWENGKVRYSLGKKEQSIELSGDVLGPSSASLQLRLDFRNYGEENIPHEVSYLVYWKGSIKNRTYTVKKIKETIETDLGSFEAYRVSRNFEEGSDRKQIFWLAPDLDYSVIKIVDKNDRESEIKIKTFEEIT